MKRERLLKTIDRLRDLWVALYIASIAYTVLFSLIPRHLDPLDGHSWIVMLALPFVLFLNQALGAVLSPPIKESEKFRDTPPETWRTPQGVSIGLERGSMPPPDQYVAGRPLVFRIYEQLFFQSYRFSKSIWGWGLADDNPWAHAWVYMSTALILNISTVAIAVSVVVKSSLWSDAHFFGILGLTAFINYVAAARKKRRQVILSVYSHLPVELVHMAWHRFKIYLTVTLVAFFVGIPVLDYLMP